MPYRFQFPLWGLGFFPDFVLLRQRIVIEVDDKSHRAPAKRKADALRTHKIESAGWRVFRCWNEEALADPYGTVDRLMTAAGLTLRTKKDLTT